MKVDGLLRGLDLLGDGTETIQQLRKLVIGLAIAGKLRSSRREQLSPQTLLEEIQKQKRQAAAKGFSRREVSLAKILADELPAGFTNPQDFIQLGAIANIEKGPTGIMKQGGSTLSSWTG